MKSKFSFAWLILTLFLAAGCTKLDKSGVYYYSSNEKIYLDVRRDMLFIQFENGFPEEQKKAIVQSDPSLTPWTYHGRSDWATRTYDGSGIDGIAVLRSNGRIPSSRFNAFLEKEGVRTLSYVYEKNGEFLAVDDHFEVMLKASVEESRLKELVLEYGCTCEPFWITDGVQDKIYQVTVPKTSAYGTIRLSCIFQETGLFVWSAPNFYVFGMYDV